MHANYKIDERIIKELIYNNTNTNNNNKKLQLIIYYRNNKTSSLVMKNNLNPPPTKLQNTNIVYEFTCPLEHRHGQAEKYVGHTTTTLSKRLSIHGQTGSIKDHFTNQHSTRPTREQLTENTKIVARAHNKYSLCIKEALYILKQNPSINRQFDNFNNILKIHPNRPTQQHQRTFMIGNIDQDHNNANQPNAHNINHNVSPAIQQRIQNLINNSRNNNDSAYSPISSRLRPRTNQSQPNILFEPHPGQ